MEPPLTLFGIPLIADASVPTGCFYLIATPARLWGETYAAYQRRVAAMSVKIVNVKAPT